MSFPNLMGSNLHTQMKRFQHSISSQQPNSQKSTKFPLDSLIPKPKIPVQQSQKQVNTRSFTINYA